MKKAKGKRKTRVEKGEWREVFLATLAASGSVRLAARDAGVHRSAAYKLRESDVQFAANWQQAIDDAIDMLEVAARQRALTQSDYLLWRLLCSLRSSRYGDRMAIGIEDLDAAIAKLISDEKRPHDGTAG